MNILFVNYGDYTTNSLNHIGGFANRLTEMGHVCIVAVPHRKESISVVSPARFIPASFDELLARPAFFPNGQPADIIHAWTPRELVRRFVLAYQAAVSPRPKLLVHLEDNERYLIAKATGIPFEQLKTMGLQELDRLVEESMPHPKRADAFLGLADGVSVITDRLMEHVPEGVPTHLLFPGVDFTLYAPRPANAALRAELGLSPDERVIAFTGSNTFANESEMRELHVAVARLNALGHRTRLVRTGFNSPSFQQKLTPEIKEHVLDLGFVAKDRLPEILSLADVLVQPGEPGAFNDFRLPSKLPEFLASGRPVLLPRSNIALKMTDGVEAIFLRDSSPETLASQILELWNATDARREEIAHAGTSFARKHFDLGKNTAGLLSWYEHIRVRQDDEQALRVRLDLVGHDLVSLRRIEGTDAFSPLQTAQEALKLTQDHAANLERLLTEKKRHLKTVTALTRQHIQNLETLRQAEARQAEQRHDEQRMQHEREMDALRNTLMASETRLALANKRAADTEVAAREKVDHLNQEIDRLKSEVRQKADKARRMQASASWQLTAPLRSLRRLLVDPFTRKGSNSTQPETRALASAGSPSGSASAGDTPSETSGFAPLEQRTYTFNIDHPRSWSTTASKMLILGWCFENSGAPIRGVRVRIGETTVEGTYGSKRLDVLASVGGKPQAQFCGVKVEFKTELGEHHLYLEVKHDDGWRPYFETTIRVGQPGDVLEQSEYEKWCQQHEALSNDDLDAIQAHISAFAKRPLFSVIVPVYNPPIALFRKALESVRAQLYPHWELCIADDASSDPDVRAVLEEFAAKDERIKVTFREKNGHISAATNSALKLASGDYVVLFDHDDVLHRNALYEVAAELDAHPGAAFIYTDEDKIDGEDRRFDPYFKPDWNPDLILGQNFTSHLSVFRRELVESIGGMRLGFEGSQDWDLTLRIVEKVSSDQIRHIPKVLYHWRAIPGSTALQISEKSYPVDAAKRALTEHLERTGAKAELLPIPGDHWRIRHALPSPPPKVGLIIPTRNAGSLVRQAVESILEKTTYPNYEIILVDNGSDEKASLDTFEELRQRSKGRLKVLRYDAPFNYSAINNFAVSKTDAEVIGLINNDIEVITPSWLEEMVSQALRPGIGAVGAMLYYPNNTVQHAGVVLGLGGVAGHAFKEFPRGDQGQKNRLRLVQNYSGVTGACLVMRKDRYLEVGGLNEKDLAVAFNDVDLCCKLITAGYRNLWTPYAELYHHESATRGIEDTPEKKARFQSEVDYMMKTWESLLQNDPAYNPNLTLVGEDFSTAYLPRTEKPWLIART